MKITTIGLGYIGLPTSVMFANHGAEVLGVDVKPEVVESLNNGQIHIEEPGLQEALEEAVQNKKFKASLYPEKADVFIISVPTPNNNDEHKSMDPNFIQKAIDSIVPYLERGNVIIVESTIAPRTTEDLLQPKLEEAGFQVGEDIFLVHCPERVLPGKIMDELIYNNRIVGGITDKCTEEGAKVYSKFVKGEIIKTSAKTAEMSKLMENTFRDVNIALANELAQVCNELDINTLDVIEMANKHPRVNLHTPGPGVGGHCLAVDPYFIISEAPETANIIKTARETNNSMPEYVVSNISKLMKQVDGKVVTIFGLAYKGNVDDIRESPAMDIYNQLRLNSDYEVRVHDPHVKQGWVEEDMEASVANSDLIVVLTDHDEFKALDTAQLSSMNHARVFDTKNIVSGLPVKAEYINYGNLYQHTRNTATVK